MKKMMTAVALLGLSLPVAAQAMEFQPIGTLGMGGAGVARNTGALTAYWNPAGGAFNTSPFATNIGIGVGARGSDGLAENVDRFKDVNFESLKDFNGGAADPKKVGDFVKAITILEDIEKRKGNIAQMDNVPIGFSIKRYSFGLFGNFEGNIAPKVDTVNILPNTLSGSTSSITLNDLATAAAGTPTPTTNIFSSTQQTNILNQLTGAGLNGTQAQDVLNAIAAGMSGTGISADTAYATVTNTVIPTVQSSTGSSPNTVSKNTSSVLTKGLVYVEAPLSYGYPFDFGSKGRLGVGATAKIIRGQVFQSQVLLVNRPDGDNVSSSDLTKELTKNSETTVNFGVDLGAMYKYDTWFTAGLVAKNLNSPKFNGPKYSVPTYNSVTQKVETTTMAAGEDVTVKPQVRLGVAFDPYSWLSIASDLDLTENETVAPGSVVGSSTKSRNFGGGLELHPYSWLRLRGGAYKNLAASDVGMVLTAGFTVFVLDVDGAFATDTFKVGGTTLPQEAKVQVSMSFAF